MGKPRYRLQIAVTVDGYIAEEDGSVGYLEGTICPEMDFEGFLASFDAIVMGRVSYEQCLDFGWPYGKTRSIVVASRPVEREAPEGVEFHHGSIRELMDRMEREGAGDVWLMGGRKLVEGFLAEGVKPRLELAVVPTLLGRGIPLFGSPMWRSGLRRVETKTYSNGLVMLTYDPA